MKKYSVLFQRAVLLTAVVLLIAVAVGSPVYHFVNRRTAFDTARKQLEPQAGLLAEAAGQNEERFNAYLRLLEAGGEHVWSYVYPGDVETLAGDFILPDSVRARLETAADGELLTFSERANGRVYLFALQSFAQTSDGLLAVVLAQDVTQLGSGALASLLGLLAGFLAACLAGWPLAKALFRKPLGQIAALRDVAVSMAGGDFDARANEAAEGELGEVGKALNNLSYQLSRNMYMLIIERNRLKHMLNGLSEGIIAIDDKGLITHINPAIAGMFTQKKVSVGLPDPRMKYVPDKSVWEDFDAVIKSGEPVTRNINSRDMVLRLTITPIVDEIGATAGAVALFSDITQMERLDRTRREYVSNVSHELRTPLTAVRALIEPLKEGMVTAEADRMRYYDIILREVMRLSRLINDQLELSRLQSGNVAILKQKMALDDLVYDVCDRYSSIAADHHLTLNIETDFSGCPQVYANADRVEQMLIILLDNAIKYTEQGSVNVSAVWDEEKVTLTVRDTGIGIAEEDLPYVFDRFYKVDKAHSGKGSGLGLSIAKELLTRMEEEIWVTSVKNEGTAFSFTIHTPTTAG